MVTSAQLIGQTRLCTAQDCPHDAEPRLDLCRYCIARARAGRVITTQVAIPIGDTLRCSKCRSEKPDAQFSYKKDARTRRFRHHECKTCAQARRQAARALLTPEQILTIKQQQLERQRSLRARKREELNRIRQAYT